MRVVVVVVVVVIVDVVVIIIIIIRLTEYTHTRNVSARVTFWCGDYLSHVIMQHVNTYERVCVWWFLHCNNNNVKPLHG